MNRRSSLWTCILNLPFLAKFDPNMEEIVGKALFSLILKIIGAGLAFMFSVILARLLGAEGAGIYYLALNVAAIATVVGRIGLDNVLLRYIAANSAVGHWKDVKGVYVKSMKLGLFVSGLSAILMLVVSPGLSELLFKKPNLSIPMQWMSLSVVPIALLFLHAESIKGLRRTSAALFVQSVCIPGFSLIIIPFFVHLWGVNGAVCARTLAAVLTMICGMLLWEKFCPLVKDCQSRIEYRWLLGQSIPLFWVALMNLVMNWTATFMLGIWGSSADVGIFSIAQRTAFLISFILIAVNSIAAPKFAEFHKVGDFESLSNTVQKSAKLMIFLAGPMLVIAILAPSWVMSIFGAEFSRGGAVLSILAVGQFINVATGSVGYILMMCGYERSMRNAVAIAAVVNLISNYLLTPQWGPIGAALSTAISVALMNLIEMFVVRRRMKIWTLPFLPNGRSSLSKNA